ncbi:hypothetical protein, partial [Mycolicibacterium fortuitum]|uniref:hypothetical protein n=1 Tax=Mycolicibacterium fortuitum TaxID=1766 RepID=UPI002633502F
DPSCAAWVPILNTLAGTEKNIGWGGRDPSIAATAWSPEQRKLYQDLGQAIRAAADQTEPMIRLTTHRVMRQLYEQFIAYSRAFADRIPTYTEPDNALARTFTQASNVLGAICDAITHGSAAARAPLVPGGAAPDGVAHAGAPAIPKPFLSSPDAVCSDWVTASDQFASDTADWRQKTDLNIPASQWSPELKTLNDAVIPTMRESAATIEELGRRSENAVLQDLAQLATQYRRAFAEALPTYSTSDKYLYDAGVYPVGMVRQACEAAGE